MPANDTYVISAAYDRTIRMWHPSLQADNSRILRKTDEKISCLALSPATEVMAISVFDLRNELLDTKTGNVIAILQRPEQVWTLRFSPDGQRVYGGCRGGMVCCWEVGGLLPIDGKEPETIPYREIRGARATVSCVSASSSWVVSISDDGDVRAAKLASGAILTESIGRVGTIFNTNRADLSPISEDGVGLAVSCPTGSERMTVYRYTPWDIPGVYKK
ncbi:hypothetical protein FRB99_006339 [Tulasnella sp. 403]|nr:hypothetical protein FRB99_006339 [Tulasnella sp. 403]